MTKKILIAVVALVIVAGCLLFALGPMLQRKIFYPKPKALPAIVNKSTEQLLSELTVKLEKLGTNYTKTLRPGLTDKEISTLESNYNISLPSDIRALYKWRNGADTNEFFPGHYFPSLDYSLQARASLSSDLKSQSVLQRAAFKALAGDRTDWLEIFPDGAGDGYFFDSTRTEKEGPFFYHMAEAGAYVWFPSIKNFLAALNECFETGIYRPATNGVGLDADFEKAESVWQKYGQPNER